MFSFEDLQKVQDNEALKAQFVVSAINAFRQTQAYKESKDGEAYYAKHNVTIEKFQKWLYTAAGDKYPDLFSSNYKIKTLFFRRLVQQQVAYLLGNGVTLENPELKEKLGKDFDFKLQLAAKRSMASGKAYGFWNADHMEVFGYADTPNDAGFCPLNSEMTGDIGAGIRFWYKGDNDKQVLRATLYEADGISEYIQPSGKECALLEPKRGYKKIVRYTEADGVDEVTYENYGTLPIVPLFCNDDHQSELVGIREAVDCYDHIKSGVANDIDDLGGFFWVLENTGGMDDKDVAAFVHRMKTVRGAATETDGAKASVQTYEVPVASKEFMLNILRKDIYEDFQSLDVSTLSATAKTATEINAAYQSMDNKCDDFEYYLIDFCEKIFALAGINDTPHFTRNKIVNQLETTNMILSAAAVLPQEMIIKKLPFLSDDEIQEVLDGLDKEAFEQMQDEDEDIEEEDIEEDDEDNSSEIESQFEELRKMIGG